ncbi:transcriptional repressor general negative regulator of transcription subunit 4 [Apophysomyces sp. BC1034]|nr:transcriptional repressor general negative regulator of transcription subunit 4 [Apophysomyces sp. BC1015]KAG0179858.1 transcriptional repressor general negative regulator of transcription subunit 4 [Apophysomyces sp. BC1021]KAG0190532.1 transcriptional repressor general negative regulator of transcription subunit 4 [Apophysomyces sp. BC1034]
MDSDDEDYECPLCMEELDIADRNFRPCTCGYQICRFCWHHIKENLNGRCPACRREYSDQMVEFQPISSDEIARIKREKKEKERQQKDMEAANRRHLANMRVVQKNLVYVIGLHPKLATEDTVRSQDFFGQFGKIAKVVINKRPVAPTPNASGSTTMQPSAAVYVTYQRREDAAKAIHAVDGSVMAGRILRASYGTTKYCTYYLRNLTCPNPTCLYLHEPGEEADTISKEELATGKHRMRDQMSTDAEDRTPNPPPVVAAAPLTSNDFPPVTSSNATRKPATLESVATISYKLPTVRQDSVKTSNSDVTADDERSALPASASWAKCGSGPSTPVLKSNLLPERALTPDAFGPPLSAAAATTQKSQSIPPMPRRKTEKKKRKEQQKADRADETPKSSRPATPSQLDIEEEEDQVPVEVKINQRATYYDGLVKFVLGDAFDEVCPLPLLDKENDLDDMPVGVSALHDDNISARPSPPPGMAADDSRSIPTMSALEFLTYATPTPSYTGTFNPFTHQLLRSTNNLWESPMRKSSRFGFAQV